MNEKFRRSPLSSATGRNMINLSTALLGALCLVLGAVMLTHHQVEAMQLVEQADQFKSASSSASLALIENPELTVRVLENLLRSILFSTMSASELQSVVNGVQKRGLDLGISRGFSGSQAGKHLMGLSAASFANGPGRR